MENIIVSLTTIPSRFNDLEVVMKNLLDQTFIPNKIILYIPKYYYRFGSKYDIPKWMTELEKNNKIFEIHFIDKDYGPATKLLPATKEFTKSTDIIITVDDDILLEKHTLEELVYCHKKYPDMNLGFMGTIGKQFIHSEWITGDIKEVELLGGYRGVLYPRKLIKDDIYKYFDDITKEKMLYDDDFFFASYFKKNKVGEYVVRTNYPDKGSLNWWNHRILDFKDKLNCQGNQHNMESSVEIIKKYFS